MRITQECDYAIRIMVYLSSLIENKREDALSIAEKQRIPSRFTVKILRKLILAKLIKSYKGVKGGYAIAILPEDINLKDIIEVIDGPVELNKCISEEFECNRTDKCECRIHSVFADINKMVEEKLSNITLKDMI